MTFKKQNEYAVAQARHYRMMTAARNILFLRPRSRKKFKYHQVVKHELMLVSIHGQAPETTPDPEPEPETNPGQQSKPFGRCYDPHWPCGTALCQRYCTGSMVAIPSPESSICFAGQIKRI